MNQAIALTLEPRRAFCENHDVSIQKPPPRAEQMRCSQRSKQKMEPLWSPVVATCRNQRQIGSAPEPQEQAKTVAVLCDWLPKGAHGKQGVCRGLPPVAGDPLPAKEEVDPEVGS
jgi:hypothetical protein